MLYIFFFNDTAPTEIYTLSLPDALPISLTANYRPSRHARYAVCECMVMLPENALVIDRCAPVLTHSWLGDRKSTRLNSSHGYIPYAVFCLKNKTIMCGSTTPTLPWCTPH